MHIRSSSPGIRRMLVVLMAGIILLVILYFVTAQKIQAAPQMQPINFNHSIMVQSGITCLYCHTDAMKSPAAGIPSVEKCMGCHKVIAKDTAQIQKVAAYLQNQQPIQWVRIYRLPRFVFFSHEVHIAQGLNCERCHGDVGHMTTTVAAQNMNMGWCLHCHTQQPNAAQLRDCVICHR